MIRKMQWLATVLLCLAAVACNSSNSPRAVTEDFWQAVVAGDLKTAKSLATTGSKAVIRMPEGVGNVQLDEVQQEGQYTLVVTSIEKGSGDDALTLSFNTVLESEDGSLRVNFNRTVKSMLSNSSAQLWTALSSRASDVGSSIGDAVDEALEDAAGEMNEAMQELAEELQKAADELRRDN